jgi:hypothetical protein
MSKSNSPPILPPIREVFPSEPLLSLNILAPMHDEIPDFSSACKEKLPSIHHITSQLPPKSTSSNEQRVPMQEIYPENRCLLRKEHIQSDVERKNNNINQAEVERAAKILCEVMYIKRNRNI